MTELTRRTFIIGLCLASAAALAAGKTEATGSLARLKAFLKSTTSARGTFRQTVIDRSGREVSKPSSGYFRFMRPGRFEWTYEKPYVQRIMSDGKTLWIHDPELFQVTEKALEGRSRPRPPLFSSASATSRRTGM
jgi:outer membrane lipoprotein carrier protein